MTTNFGGRSPAIGKLRQTRPHERPQQAIGDAEVSVRLERERRRAARGGQRDDRAAGEAAAADGDVGPHLA